MQQYIKEAQIRWSDLDPNAHLRHSVYYDWGAFVRVSFLQQHNLSTAEMQRLQIGPILFREECVFKREIRLGDTVTISVELAKARRDFSRWTIQHTIMKNGDTVAAILTVDGAWLDTAKRKLAASPQMIIDVFSEFPRTVDFSWMD